MLLCFVFARLCHFVKVPHAESFVNSTLKHIRKPNSSVSKWGWKYLQAVESDTFVYSEAGLSQSSTVVFDGPSMVICTTILFTGAFCRIFNTSMCASFT